MTQPFTVLPIWKSAWNVCWNNIACKIGIVTNFQFRLFNGLNELSAYLFIYVPQVTECFFYRKKVPSLIDRPFYFVYVLSDVCITSLSTSIAEVFYETLHCVLTLRIWTQQSERHCLAAEILVMSPGYYFHGRAFAQRALLH